jgi:hypothetical protein
MSVAQAVRAGRAFVELGARDEKFVKSMSNAEKRLNAFAASVGKIGAASIALGGAALGGLAAMSKVFANSADDMDTMATKTGMSVEAISELALGVKQANLQMGDLEGSVARMQRVLAGATQGDAGSLGAIEDLGLSIEQLQGLHPDRQFEVIADAIAAIEDPAQKTAAAMGIFGRSGANLIPLLDRGAKGLQDMRARARELGLTMSTSTAKAGAQLADAFDELDLVVARTAQKIGEAFAPAMRSALDAVTPLLVHFGEFVSANPAIVMAIGATAAGAVVLGTALVGVAIAAKAAAIAIGLLMSPVVLVSGAVLALTAAIVGFTVGPAAALSAAGDAIAGAWTETKGVLDDLTKALQSGDMETAGKIAADSLEMAFATAALNIAQHFQKLFTWIGETLARLMASATSAIAATIAPDQYGDSAAGKGIAGLANRIDAEFLDARLDLNKGVATPIINAVEFVGDSIAGAYFAVGAGLEGLAGMDPNVRWNKAKEGFGRDSWLLRWQKRHNAGLENAIGERDLRAEGLFGEAGKQYLENYNAQESYRKQMIDAIGKDFGSLLQSPIDALQKRLDDAKSRLNESRTKARLDALYRDAEAGYNAFNAADTSTPKIKAAMDSIGEAFESISQFGGIRGAFALTDTALAGLRGGPTGQVLERIDTKISNIQRAVERMEPGYLSLG